MSTARAVLLLGGAAVVALAASRALDARALAVTELLELPQVTDQGDAGAAASLLAGLGDAAETLVGVVDDAAYDFTGYRLMTAARWQAAAARPENALYVAAAHAAEVRYGLPFELWVRQLWQESRFNPDAHNARSNATGIAQIVPRWHPAAIPSDPLHSIDYGARYMRDLFRQFGTWELALKAYNWGPGNLQKFLSGGDDAPAEPLETQNYSRQILADLAAAGQGVA